MNIKPKILLKRLIADQKGAALVLALIIFAVGSLMVLPLLSFMGSGFKSTDRVYNQKANELYAADSGVRDGILKIQQRDGLPSAIGNKTDDTNIGTINGKEVVYNITSIDPTPFGGSAVYRITSTAGNTTITADAVMIDFTKVFTRNVVTSPDEASIKNNVNFSGPIQAGGFDNDGDGVIDDDIKAEPINGFISSILIPEGSGGHDYTNPTVVIDPDNGTGATGASATAIMEDGVITGLLMNSGGEDYIGPKVVFTDSAGRGKNAAATAVVRDGVMVSGVLTDGVIVDIIVTDGGFGYSAENLTIEIEGGSGSGVYIDPSDATIEDGVIKSIILSGFSQGGSGYKYPTIEIIDGAGITAEAKSVLGEKGTVYEGKVISINPVVLGTGYNPSSPPVVHIDSPPSGGTQAIASPILTSGNITGYTMVNKGSGYKKAPNVWIDPSPPGPGTGAIAVATVMNTELIDSSNLSMIWPSAGGGSNPLKVFYMEEVQELIDASVIDEDPISGGTITLDSGSGPMYIQGNVTFTTASESIPTTLADTAEDIPRLIFVDGTVTFTDCNVNLNHYTIFSTSTADAANPDDAATTRAINVQNSAEVSGPGALITVGGINFQPKGNNNQYIYVMSLNGKVRLAPMNDFVGSVAAPEVVVQSGNGANVTWADPSQLDPPLNLPGGEVTETILAGFISWKID